MNARLGFEAGAALRAALVVTVTAAAIIGLVLIELAPHAAVHSEPLRIEATTGIARWQVTADGREVQPESHDGSNWIGSVPEGAHSIRIEAGRIEAGRREGGDGVGAVTSWAVRARLGTGAHERAAISWADGSTTSVDFASENGHHHHD
ncbi:MAG: hypothetical protein H0V44_04940 [Planctomycetes bacterium]|nr:hypothetical protein [Planctomycetota bacterium]